MSNSADKRIAVLRTVLVQGKEQCSELIGLLQAQLDAGDLIGLTVIAEDASGCYETHSTSATGRLQMAGALLEAAIEKVQNG